MTTRPVDYASLDTRQRHSGWLRSRFSRWHAGTALVLWLGFSILTLAIMLAASDNTSDRPLTIAATTACTALGPMTGAVSRDFQGCCLEFSLWLLPYCLAGVLLAVLVQVLVPPSGPWLRALRLLVWVAGLLIWFGGGVVSFGHALS